MSYYLANPVVAWYYDQIQKAGSLEVAVDKFWNNCLPNYFTQALMYGIEQEQRPLEGIVQKRADFTIRFIKNGDPKKVVVLMEDKRRGKESLPAEWWRAALNQLTDYLKLVRTEQTNDEILYDVVTIGTYCRFYELHPSEGTMRDFIDPNIFELKTNEKDVHEILLRLVALTSHSSTWGQNPYKVIR